LNAAVVATGVYAATEDWGSGGAADGSLVQRIDRAARELSASMAARESSAPTDPFADPVPFDQLFRRS
jgi:FMN reductase